MSRTLFDQASIEGRASKLLGRHVGGGQSRVLALEVAGTVVVIVAAIFFARTSAVATSILAFTFVWVLLGQSWNIISGLAGPLALGQAAFFGLTEVLTLVLHQNAGLNTYLAILLGLAACVVLAVIVGIATLRLPAFFFAIATLTVPLIIEALVENAGYTEVLRTTYSGNTPSQFWWTGPYPYLVIAGILIMVLAAATAILMRARIGRFWVAIRENERAADASGIPTTRYKLYAFVIGAVIAGVAGAIYIQLIFVFAPTSVFAPQISVLGLVVVLVGGSGTVFGPVLGGLIIGAGKQLTNIYMSSTPGLPIIGYAVLLLIVAFWFPRGVYPSIAQWVRNLRARRQRIGPQPTAETVGEAVTQTVSAGTELDLAGRGPE